MQYLGLISGKVAIGDNRGAYRIFKIAISIFGAIGFLCTLILFIFAGNIAKLYIGIPEAEYTILALAPSIFVVSISAVLRGYFNGIENVNVTAHSQSIEQILKTLFTIIIVEFICYISKRNTNVMVASAALSCTIATFFSFGYLYVIYMKKRKEIWKDVMTSTITDKEGVLRITKNILHLSLPMAFTSLIAATNKTIDAVSIVNIISKFMPIEQAKLQYGILTGKVESLVFLPYAFNIAFSVNLIPAIAAARATKNMKEAIKRIKISILATILICLPCMGIFIYFAEPILKMLFPNAHLGAQMLKVSSISIIFVAITQTIGGILQGLKKVKEPAIAIAVGTIVKVILNYILLPIEKLNIYGAIVATIIGHISTFAISVVYLRRYIEIKFNVIKFIVKPIIATIIMIFTSNMVYNYFIIKDLKMYGLIISLTIGTMIYGILIYVLKVFTKEELAMIPFINKFNN